MTVTGLNSSGTMAGYASFSVKFQGVKQTVVQAFVWNDSTQVLTNLNTAIGAASSMATCVSSAGAVAGVYWTPGVGSQQLGFTWQNGTVTSFQSPDDGDVEDVVAINGAGQVIGTYYGGYGLKRAFLWDGTTSTDLGDLGDPDNSFVWPQAINEAGKVIGTVYGTEDGVDQKDGPRTAFQWSNGVMSALPNIEDNGQTTAISINGLGQIVGTSYTNPPSFWMSNGITRGVFWDGNSAAEIGSLGGGETIPFSIGTAGLVTGTTYAADSVLHLFHWQNGVLGDLGVAQLNAGDTSFQATNVNQSGDVVGLTTDASGACQAFLRTGSVFYNLAAIMPQSLGFIADNSNGNKVLVNDAGLVACSGLSQGVPVAFLLTPDSDNDGLPDGWEMSVFGNLNQTASGDPDGDGLTNLQEFQQGTSPTDYYNHALTDISIDSGNNQSAGPDSFTVNPLVVRVVDGTTNAAKVNAPITFTSATAQLAVASNGMVSSSVQVRSDSQGRATVYLKLPATGVYHQVTATAISGASTAQVTFYAALAELIPSPSSVSLSVDQGEVQERILTLTNTLNQSLNYAVDPSSVTASGTTPETPQDANNPEYNWSDSDTVGGPAYVWNEISTTGTLLTNISDADDNYQQVNFAFNLPFFGNTYSSVFVSSNGYLTIGAGSIQYQHSSLPSTSMPLNLIAPFFTDLHTGISGEVYALAEASKLTIEFNNVAPFNGSSSNTYTFQVVLESNGKITFYYKTMNAPVNNATVGIQNSANPPHGRQVAYNQAYIHNGLAVQFHPLAAVPGPWLQLKNYAGTVAAGESASVDMVLNTAGLSAGTYTATLHLKDSQGNTVGPDVPVTWTVSGNAVVDTDGDGLPDAWEMQHFGNLNQGANDDPDHDGLSNLLEYRLGSDPLNPDTNGDGILDGVAYRLGISATNLDMDGDGVSNAVERQRGTDPFSRDSDRDGVPDGQDAFPLDPTRSQIADASLNDHTVITITLLEPSNATLLP